MSVTLAGCIGTREYDDTNYETSKSNEQPLSLNDDLDKKCRG